VCLCVCVCVRECVGADRGICVYVGIIKNITEPICTIRTKQTDNNNNNIYS